MNSFDGRSHSQNHTLGEVYHRISASDKDSGYKGYVTYSMEVCICSIKLTLVNLNNTIHPNLQFKVTDVWNL